MAMVINRISSHCNLRIDDSHIAEYNSRRDSAFKTKGMVESPFAFHIPPKQWPLISFSMGTSKRSAALIYQLRILQDA